MKEQKHRMRQGGYKEDRKEKYRRKEWMLERMDTIKGLKIKARKEWQE